MGQEELSALKEQVNRPSLFSPDTDMDTQNSDEDDFDERVLAQEHPTDMLRKQSQGVLRLSCKQARNTTILVCLQNIVVFLSDNLYMIV